MKNNTEKTVTLTPGALATSFLFSSEVLRLSCKASNVETLKDKGREKERKLLHDKLVMLGSIRKQPNMGRQWDFIWDREKKKMSEWLWVSEFWLVENGVRELVGRFCKRENCLGVVKE